MLLGIVQILNRYIQAWTLLFTNLNFSTSHCATYLDFQQRKAKWSEEVTLSRFIGILPLDVLHVQVIFTVFSFCSNIGSVFVIGIGPNWLVGTILHDCHDFSYFHFSGLRSFVRDENRWDRNTLALLFLFLASVVWYYHNLINTFLLA